MAGFGGGGPDGKGGFGGFGGFPWSWINGLFGAVCGEDGCGGDGGGDGAINGGINSLKKNAAGFGEQAIKQFNGLTDGLQVLADVKSAIKVAQQYGGLEPAAPGQDRPTFKPGVPGSKENPVPKILSDTTNQTLSKGINSNMSGSELKKAVQNNINTDFNFGAKGTINNLTSDPYFNDNGDLVINDTYLFDSGGDIGDKTFIPKTPFTPEVTVGQFAKQQSGGDLELEKDVLTFFDKSLGALLPGLTPSSKDPMVNIQITVPSNNIKESREVITGSRKRILREIKQPYKLPEQPKQKYKMNFKGKFTAQNTPNVTASKKSDEVVTAKNAAGQTWRTKDKYWSGYESTERMNVIYDHVGHGQIYWDTIVNDNKNKKNIRDREIQEHLNLIDHNKAMKEIIEQQTLDAPKDPLFKKVAKRLKTEIDYPDKPSKNGYPDTPPPEMVNGFHPEYGKRYKYDKLDPHSAEAMPVTGDPEIDINVQKMIDVKKKAVKLKNILGKGG